MGYQYQNDSALIRDLQVGNTEAFGWLYKKYRLSLTILAEEILRDRAEAQDTVQQYFISFWEKKLFDKVQPNENGEVMLGAYLSVCIRNLCLNIMQAKRRSPLNNTEGLNEAIALFSPEETQEIKETREKLFRALDEVKELLTPKVLKAMELAYVDDRSYKEIAEECNISINTVRNLLVKGRKIMREKLSFK